MPENNLRRAWCPFSDIVDGFRLSVAERAPMEQYPSRVYGTTEVVP
jgi:hypothetical protein